MRELIIKRIAELTEDGEFLEDHNTSMEQVESMSDEELMELFEEVIFPG